MWLTARVANNVTRMLCDFWTKLVTIAAASSFTRMKTRASTLPFFLACLLLEMRNALLANGLKEFSRGKLTDSWEHLPLFREAAQSGAKKQTVSNTEDTTYYVADQFNGMVSRSTNPRQFLQGVMNGPLKFLTASKILPLLDLLAKSKRVLVCLVPKLICSCSHSHARFLVSIARECVDPSLD